MQKVVSEVQRFAPGAFYWETFSEEIKSDLCCAAFHEGAEVALIDPVPLSMKALNTVAGRADRAVVLLTNANHERGASCFHEKFLLHVQAHRDAQPALTIKPTHLFKDGDMLVAGLRAIHIPGSAPGETAFYTPANGGIVFIGDALVNLPTMGGLAFLPDKYCDDPKQSRESLRKLLTLDFEMMTFAHGKPIVRGAKAQVAALLEGKQDQE